MKIKRIFKEKVKCKVYNLEVEGNPTYYANGILVHNCRSQLVPITIYEEFEPIARDTKMRILAGKPKGFMERQDAE